MDEFDRLWGKDVTSRGGIFQDVTDKGFGFVQRQGLQRYFEFDALVKGFEHGSFQAVDEVGLGDEDKEDWVDGVEVEIGDELEFMEVFVSKEMGVVEDDDGNGMLVISHVDDGLLNGKE